MSDQELAEESIGVSPELQTGRISENPDVTDKGRKEVKRKLPKDDINERDSPPQRHLVDEATDEESPLQNLRKKTLISYQRKKKKSTATSVSVPEAEPPVSLNIGCSKSMVKSVSSKGKMKVAESEKVSLPRRTTRSQAVVEALVELSGSAPSKTPPPVNVEDRPSVRTKPKKIVKRRAAVSQGTSSSPSSKKKGIPHSLPFRNADAKVNWTRILDINFLREYNLRSSTVSEYGTIELLESVGLSKTALHVRSFVKNVVLEFYANLYANIGDVASADAFTTYIRGHMIQFSPLVINSYLRFIPPRDSIVSFDLNSVISELTGGLVPIWGKNGLKASALTTKYSILHKIGIRNWIPTSNHSKVSVELADLLYRIGNGSPFDFGQMIFSHVVQHTSPTAVNRPVCFPSLIFGIIQDQVSVVVPEDIYEGPAPDIVITAKLKNTKFHIYDVEILSDDEDQLLRTTKGKSEVSIPSQTNLSTSLNKQVISGLKEEIAFLNMTLNWNTKMIPVFQKAISRATERKKIVEAFLASILVGAAAGPKPMGEASGSKPDQVDSVVSVDEAVDNEPAENIESKEDEPAGADVLLNDKEPTDVAE